MVIWPVAFELDPHTGPSFDKVNDNEVLGWVIVKVCAADTHPIESLTFTI